MTDTTDNYNSPTPDSTTANRIKILGCQVDIPDDIFTVEQRDRHVSRIIQLAREKVAEEEERRNQIAQEEAKEDAAPGGESASVAAVDMIVFPEICTISYSKATFDRVALLAERVPLPEEFNQGEENKDGDRDNYSEDLLKESPTTHSMQKLATETGALVCFGIPRVCKSHPNSFRICQVVVQPTTQRLSSTTTASTPPVVCAYDKMHVCNDPRGTYCEGNYFSPKNKELDPPQHRGLQILNFKGFRIAMTICYDFRFPVLFNNYAKHHKTDLFLHPCAFPKDDTFYNRNAFVVTRAVENVSYVLSLNRAGKAWGRTLFAPPWVSGPEGATPLVEFDDNEEELRVVEISKKVLEVQRSQTIYMEECLSTYDDLTVTESSC